MNKVFKENTASISEIKKICLEEIFRQKTIIYNKCVMHRQNTIRNGKKIYLRPITYIDLPISSVRFVEAVGKYLYSLKEKNKYEVLCGIATQGIPYVYAASQRYNIPAIYARTKQQSYGTNSYISGKLNLNSKILIVDNLIYSGETMNLVIDKVLDNGMIITGLCTVVKFETSFNKLKDNYPLYYLITVQEIYDYLIVRNYFPKPLEKYIRLFIKDQTLFHAESDLYKEYLNTLGDLKLLWRT